MGTLAWPGRVSPWLGLPQLWGKDQGSCGAGLQMCREREEVFVPTSCLCRERAHLRGWGAPESSGKSCRVSMAVCGRCPLPAAIAWPWLGDRSWWDIPKACPNTGCRNTCPCTVPACHGTIPVVRGGIPNSHSCIPPGRGAQGMGAIKLQEGLNAVIPAPTRARSLHPRWGEPPGILTPLTPPVPACSLSAARGGDTPALAKGKVRRCWVPACPHTWSGASAGPQLP